MRAKYLNLLLLGLLGACHWNGSDSNGGANASKPCCGYFTTFLPGQSWVYSILTSSSSCVVAGQNNHNIQRSFEFIDKKVLDGQTIYQVKIVNHDTMQLCSNPNEPPKYFIWSETLSVKYVEKDSGLYSSFPDDMAKLYGDNTAISHYQLDTTKSYKSTLFSKFGELPNLKKCRYNNKVLDCLYQNTSTGRQISLENYGKVTDYVLLIGGSSSSSWNWKLISKDGIEFQSDLVDSAESN